ncbi:MAG: peptidoglycan-binding protein [Cytophagaceae bacterium]|nr:peptidoglycan-binding protein [Gemmatimonadaceae bacterium]
MSDDKLTPTEHAIRLGDHLGRVATTYRFRSFGPLWNDAANAQLRLRRPNPHIMAAGDAVHVPELIYQEVDRPTDARHRFRAELHPLELKLAFFEWNGTASTFVPSEVRIDGKEVVAEPSAGALKVIPLEPLADRCALKLGPEELVTRIGFLQPIDTVAGVRQRLNNLGLRAGDADDPTALGFRSAVEEFQCDHHLPVDGKVGPATRSALAKAHGC